MNWLANYRTSNWHSARKIFFVDVLKLLVTWLLGVNRYSLGTLGFEIEIEFSFVHYCQKIRKITTFLEYFNERSVFKKLIHWSTVY